MNTPQFSGSIDITGISVVMLSCTHSQHRKIFVCIYLLNIISPNYNHKFDRYLHIYITNIQSYKIIGVYVFTIGKIIYCFATGK